MHATSSLHEVIIEAAVAWRQIPTSAASAIDMAASLKVRFVVLADTHGLHSQVDIPDGDVLVHAGDFTRRSNVCEVSEFLAWFASHHHSRKILVAGNHDRLFETHPELAASLIPEGITYLMDSGSQVGNLHIWGSPVQPAFNFWAFNRQRGSEISKHWDLIPDITNVLITHGPARGVLDRPPDGISVGCADLRRRIEALQPMAHFCGHVHGGHGFAQLGNTLMVNAAICDESYRPVHKPVVIDL